MDYSEQLRQKYMNNYMMGGCSNSLYGGELVGGKKTKAKKETKPKKPRKPTKEKKQLGPNKMGEPCDYENMYDYTQIRCNRDGDGREDWIKDPKVVNIYKSQFGNPWIHFLKQLTIQGIKMSMSQKRDAYRKWKLNM